MTGNEPFWDEEAKAFVQGVILYVATDPDEAGNRNLGRVRDLLLLDGEDMKTLFERMLDSPNRIVASTGARSLQKEPKVLASVIASAQAHTHFLDSPRIRESLCASDFRFEDLKTRKMTVYLALPVDRLSTFGRWLRLLIQQAITVNARNIAFVPEKPILFMLDEMGTLGRLSMIEQAYGLMAGFGIQIWGIVQDFSQLEKIYGKGWQTFVSNSGVIQYFGSRDQFTSEYFSSLTGVTTVWNLSTAISRTFGSSVSQSNYSNSSTDTSAAVQRKLAYPDELMRMDNSRQLLFIENLNPIRGRRFQWFRHPVLKLLGRNLRPAAQTPAAQAASQETQQAVPAE
jgi:type IV secretion system protein VirD4